MPPARTPLAPLALSIALPCAVGAQAAPVPGMGSDTSCLGRIPPSAYTRVPVFVHAEVVDSADRAGRPTVDVVAQEVAAHVRRLLWTAPGRTPPADTTAALPEADSLLSVRAASGAVRVVVRREARALAWRAAPEMRADTLAADAAGAALVGRALDAAAEQQGLFFPDELFRGDSLAFELRLTYLLVEGAERRLGAVTVRNPAPAFTLLVPWTQQTSIRRGTMQLRYPPTEQQRNYEGRVLLQFVVDAEGRAEPATLRDVWPQEPPPLRGADLKAYEAFAAAGREAVRNARFHPALVAGCPVRQLVRLPLAWTINR